MWTNFSKKEIVPVGQDVEQTDEFDPGMQIDFEFLLKELQDILKSPSPFILYKKSNELKEKFWEFINKITKKVSSWFNSQNKTLIVSIYQTVGYQKIWLYNLKNYLKDSKYFDLNLYFKTAVAFDKEQQYLAKWLLKLYKWETLEELQKFLHKFKSKQPIGKIKEIFNSFKLKELKIDAKYLDENAIERFLEQITISLDIDKDLFISYFCVSIDEIKVGFTETYNIFSGITRFYLKDVNIRDKHILDHINNQTNREIKLRLDNEIKKYYENKNDFYKNIVEILKDQNSTEKGYFWGYVKTEIINVYYKEITRLFYWDKNACSNRNEWAVLKWNFDEDNKTSYKDEIKSILAFKKLILNIDRSMISPFLKPIIYTIVSEKITITRKDLLKLRYLMTLIFSQNYVEYKKIYNFFEDLEAFLDFNLSSNRLININLKKLKIFTADLILTFIGLNFLYIYAPVWVFLGTVLLLGSFFVNQFKTFKSGIEWNFWTKTFATILLVISWFFWITNLDKTKVDVGNLMSQVQKIWIYNTEKAWQIAADKISRLKIWEMVADILQSRKK